MSVSFLYLVSRNDCMGYDEYIEFVVCASSEDEARRTHPSGDDTWLDKEEKGSKYNGWVKASQIDTLTVKLIGFAEPTLEKGVVCASYHAG